MPENADNRFATGAVRSADADHLDFMSMPLVGLLGVARTAFEGGSKYGRYNYMKGMPAHVCINHAFRHLVLYAMGDRSEPHLSHAAWNCMTAEQSAILNPELNTPHLPGPGYVLTPETLAHLDAEAPKLAEKRKDKEWLKTIGGWAIGGLTEIKTILGQRNAVQKCQNVANAGFAIKNYIRQKKAVVLRPVAVTTLNPPVEVKAGESAHIKFTTGKVDHRFREGKLYTYPGTDVTVVHGIVKPTKSDGRAPAFPAGIGIYVEGKRGVRYEEAYGHPTPQPGETWCEYEGGYRLYWLNEESETGFDSDRRAELARQEWVFEKDGPEAVAKVEATIPKWKKTVTGYGPGPKTGFE
jgi:hypothetical protein